MKYGPADIMNSDQKGIDHNSGENNLYREGLEFDTVAKTDSLIESMPKAQTKPTDTGILSMADENPLA